MGRFPTGKEKRRRGLVRNAQREPDALRRIDGDPGFTATYRGGPHANVSGVLGREVNRLAVRRKSELGDGTIESRRDRTDASLPGPGRGSKAAQRVIVSFFGRRGETNALSIRA